MKHLYLCRDGQTVEGPIPADQVYRMVKHHQADRLAQVCLEGTQTWMPYEKLPIENFSAPARKDARFTQLPSFKERMDDPKLTAKVWWFIALFSLGFIALLLWADANKPSKEERDRQWDATYKHYLDERHKSFERAAADAQRRMPR